MSKELKCPICGGDIQYNSGYSTYDCKNNPAEHYASEEIWQALIQATEDLSFIKNNGLPQWKLKQTMEKIFGGEENEK